jgi:hypothetical protein
MNHRASDCEMKCLLKSVMNIVNTKPCIGLGPFQFLLFCFTSLLVQAFEQNGSVLEHIKQIRFVDSMMGISEGFACDCYLLQTNQCKQYEITCLHLSPIRNVTMEVTHFSYDTVTVLWSSLIRWYNGAASSFVGGTCTFKPPFQKWSCQLSKPKINPRV